MIIERKFPCCIDVPVQENPSFNQACTGAKSGHVDAYPLREEGIDQLFVEHKLEEKQEQSSCAEDNAEPGTEKERYRTEAVKGSREIKITVKRGRVRCKGLDFDVFAATVFPQDIRHIVAGFAFSLAPGRALFHIAADMGNLPNHVYDSLLAVAIEFCQPVHC